MSTGCVARSSQTEKEAIRDACDASLVFLNWNHRGTEITEQESPRDLCVILASVPLWLTFLGSDKAALGSRLAARGVHSLVNARRAANAISRAASIVAAVAVMCPILRPGRASCLP